jgi:hypothetical protein
VKLGLNLSAQVEYEKSINISIFVKDGFEVVLFILIIVAGLNYIRDIAPWNLTRQSLLLLL